jgi:glycosyltransferase involved in cell wall biosynthesis
MTDGDASTVPAARIAVIVCAHNEQAFIDPCLRGILAQTRPADEVVVVDNASTDRTAQVAGGLAGVRVVSEPHKGLVRARATGAGQTTAELLVYLDADCRPPRHWLARMERRFAQRPGLLALSGPYRYYDWHIWGRGLIRAYDLTVAPATHLLVRHLLRRGAVFYGGNFAVRRSALVAIGGFETSIEFHGEDTNLGRRLSASGRVALCGECYVQTSARRFRAMGTWAVIRLYVRNFWSEILFHQPADVTHHDVREV